MDAEKVKKGLELCITGTAEMCVLCPYSDGCDDILKADALELIAQLEERVAITTECKHGRWEIVTYHNGCTPDYDLACSVCGERLGLPEYKYCPNCGAKMDGEVQQNGGRHKDDV